MGPSRRAQERERAVARAAEAAKHTGDRLFVEAHPTCERFQRLARHIQSIDRGLRVREAQRHPASHHFLGIEAQLFGDYGLETHERHLWTCCQASDLRGEY